LGLPFFILLPVPLFFARVESIAKKFALMNFSPAKKIHAHWRNLIILAVVLLLKKSNSHTNTNFFEKLCVESF